MTSSAFEDWIRYVESLLDRVICGAENGAKVSFHRGSHGAALVHPAAHGKDAGLAFNRPVDLAERNAGRRTPETDTAIAALTKIDQPLPFEEL